MKTEPDCLFCKIASGKLPSSKVFEDDNVIAFLDIYPAADGHVLVVPKEHAEQLTQLSDVAAQKAAVAVKKVGQAVVQAMGAEGFNVLQSNGRAAGQVIWHVHFHVIPRKENDGLHFVHNRFKPSEGELKATAEKIKEALG